MATISFQNRLQIYGSRLSKSEKKIAAYIHTNRENVLSFSSQELAQAIGTSTSTLTRFCQKLDYRNYIEFQTLLSEEEPPSNTPQPTLKKLAHYYDSVLTAACELVTPDALDSFVERIHQADKILVTGLGASGFTANEFNMRLIQMGFTSSVMTDSFLMRAQSSLFSSKDLVVVISNSGETPEVVSACQVAKSVNTPIVLLTQNCHSQIAQMADEILLAGNIRQANDPRFINSQMPLMFLLDAISYRLLEDDTCFENRTRALQILYHEK